ncbi:putative choline transporter [Plasmopara halstedii]
MYAPVSETEPMLMSSSGGKGPLPPSSRAISSLRPESSTIKCNDAFFAVMFLANVIILSILAFFKGLLTLTEEMDKNRSDGRIPNGHSVALTMIALLCVIGTALSLAWVKLLTTYASSMITIALWLNVGMVLAFAVSTFSVNVWAALFLAGLAALNVCYIYAVQNRIGFASANLKAACAGLKEHSAIFAVAFVLVLQQLAWMFLWYVASLGMHQLFLEADPNCDREIDLASRGRNRGGLCVEFPAYAAIFYMLVGLYWGQQVLQNILTCTTAGVIATWWYQPNAQKATVGALYRSITTSFGSICFGSLIVAVLQALRTMADAAKRRAREERSGGLACLACMAECVLSFLAGVMEYVNQWAYVYVGVYGYPFRKSGKAVMDLFTNRGWTAVINDDLTSSALTFGAMGVGIVTCCVGMLMVRYSPMEWFSALGSRTSAYSSMALIGFVVGLSVALILAHVIIAALHTIFVCFAEDPVAFNRNHPKHYDELVAGWRQFHGDALLSAYGGSV